MANPASALGEAIGHLFEEGVRECVREVVGARNHTIQPSRLKNGTANSYQIDAVVYDSSGKPIIIIDPKYIRYKKHNRDKVSWLCVAHYNLRKTHTTIRKSIAVLAGRWSEPSKALARSFGVEILEVPFEQMVEILGGYGIAFDWPEDNRGEIASESLQLFNSLGEEVRMEIARDLTRDIADDLRIAVSDVLDADISNLPARISGVEMLLKTNREELILHSFDSVAESLQYMLGLVSDRTDVTDLVLSKSLEDDQLDPA